MGYNNFYNRFKKLAFLSRMECFKLFTDPIKNRVMTVFVIVNMNSTKETGPKLKTAKL